MYVLQAFDEAYRAVLARRTKIGEIRSVLTRLRETAKSVEKSISTPEEVRKEHVRHRLIRSPLYLCCAYYIKTLGNVENISIVSTNCCDPVMYYSYFVMIDITLRICRSQFTDPQTAAKAKRPTKGPSEIG